MKSFLAKTRKALVTVPGLVASLVALGVLPADLGVPISSAVAALTAILVYLVPNAADPVAEHAAP